MPDQISISMKAIRWVASGSEGSVLILFVLDLAINYICSDFPGQWQIKNITGDVIEAISTASIYTYTFTVQRFLHGYLEIYTYMLEKKPTRQFTER